MRPRAKVTRPIDNETKSYGAAASSVGELRYRPATWYCVNCGLSVGQCRDLFFSRWCRLSSSRGNYGNSTLAGVSSHLLSCSRQWWMPPLGSSSPRRGSSTSLRSFVSCTGWRLKSRSHSNNQSSCTSVYTGPQSTPAYLTDELCQVADVEARQRLRSSSSSSLIVSRTRLFTVGDRAFPVAAARVWNSLLDLVTSAPSVTVFRPRFKSHLFNISYPCDCTVPARWL